MFPIEIVMVLFLVVFSLFIVPFAFVVFGQAKHQTDFVFLNTGTPDSYGNRIAEIEVLQDTGGGSYVSRGTLNYSDYVASTNLVGIQNQTTQFEVVVWLNYTFADSPTQARQFTQLYVTVTGEFTRQIATWTDTSADGTDYWILTYLYTWDRPAAGTYTVYLYYESLGGTLPNAEDLQLVAGPDGWIYTPEGTVYTTGPNDYATTSSFTPLHDNGDFSVELWIDIQDNTTTQQLVSQYVSSNNYVAIQVYGPNNRVYADVKDGASRTYASLAINEAKYHIVLTWDKNNNSGKLNLWVNGTLSVAGSGLTTNSDANDNFELARISSGSNYVALDTTYYSVALYDDQLTRDEVEFLYAEGGDYGFSDVWHIWTFEDYALGFTTSEIGADHDALDGLLAWASRETWEIDLQAVTYASYLYPFPADEPELWIWLIGGVVGLIVVPVVFGSKIRSDEEHRLRWVLALVFGLAVCWSIFIGM